MTGFILVGLLVVALGAALAALVLTDTAATEAQAEQHLRRDVLRADAQIGVEARKARRAMNTAAGQSWRNRFE